MEERGEQSVNRNNRNKWSEVENYLLEKGKGMPEVDNYLLEKGKGMPEVDNYLLKIRKEVAGSW